MVSEEGCGMTPASETQYPEPHRTWIELSATVDFMRSPNDRFAPTAALGCFRESGDQKRRCALAIRQNSGVC
jgi:hypothetical protein